MAAQPHRLLVHRGLIPKDGRLGEDAGVVDGAVFQDGFQPLIQALGVLFHPAGAEGFDFAHALFHRIQPAGDIGQHFGALDAPHFHKVFQRLGGDVRDILPQLVLVHLSLAGGEDVGEPGQQADGDVVLDAQVLGQVAEGLLVAAGQVEVSGDGGGGGLGVLDGEAQLHLAPGDAFVQLGLEPTVHESAAAGDPGAVLEIARIDAAQLHRDLPAIAHTAGAAIPCHTIDHNFSSLFMFAHSFPYIYPSGAYCPILRYI